MKYKNLTVIGTSHIAKQSVNDIKQEFKKLMPDIIAIELDSKRLFALLNKNKIKQRLSIRNIFRIGITGFFFSLLGEWLEKKLGEYVGIMPGTDMLTAYRIAKKNNKQVAVIDQDINITLKRLSKAITWKEKWNFLVDIFKAVILRKKDIKGFDLRTVPNQEIINKLMTKTKIRYPNLFRVLVTERNDYMAKKLVLLMKNNHDKQILATVGAGHEKEMIKLIKKKLHNIEIVYSNTFTVNE